MPQFNLPGFISGESKKKYNNKEIIIDGIKFPSIKEGTRYNELLIMERAGLIRNIVLQPEFILLDKFTDKFGKKYRAIGYRGDFQYEECDDDTLVVEDTKGFKTKEFRIKEKLFRHRFPNIKFLIS